MSFLKKMTFLSTDVRRGWIVCNVIMAAFPILVTLLSSSENVYAVVLSYCYALMIVGAYLFYQYTTIHGKPENGYTFFWSSVAMIILVLIWLYAYHSNQLVASIIDYHPIVTATISAVTIYIALWLAYHLNMPIISRQEAELEDARKHADEQLEKAGRARASAQALKGNAITTAAEVDNEDI